MSHCTRTRFIAIVFLVLGSIGAAAHGEDAFFAGVGDLPGGNHFSFAFGVSSTGDYVVGYSRSAQGDEAYRWSMATGMQGLGDIPDGLFGSYARGVSADGNYIVGRGQSHLGLVAMRWTPTSGPLPHYDLFASIPGHAYAVSADALVTCGEANHSDNGIEAFRWTANELEWLGHIDGTGTQSAAIGMNDDGSVVVGYDIHAGKKEAFLHTADRGMVGLGDLAGGAFASLAFDASADGAIIVGDGKTAAGDAAFRWTQATGMTQLPCLDGTLDCLSAARGISSDGSRIVGHVDGYMTAVMWTDAGARSIADILTNDYGIQLDGWQLSTAEGISADGATIIGNGISPSGQPEGWVAVIPVTCQCPGDVNRDHVLNGRDIQALVDCIADFGSECGCANLDGQPGIVAGDIAQFIDLLLNDGGC